MTSPWGMDDSSRRALQRRRSAVIDYVLVCVALGILVGMFWGGL